MLKITVIAVLTLACLSARAQNDLKSYYEQQKAAIVPTFSAPELGSQVTTKLKSGQTRTGVLMKLDTASVTIMSDSGSMITYQRNALQEETRTLLFAEDYAHLKALEKTRMYKEEQNMEFKAQQEAGIHDGSISVLAKTEKENETEKTEEERENKSRGETIKIKTTTKTYKETQKLAVTVTNKSNNPDKFTLEYYFFGEAVAKGGAQNKKDNDKKKAAPDDASAGLKVFDKGIKSVTVSPRGREKIDLSSKVFEVKKVMVDNGQGHSGNPPKETGIESAGYLVILKYGSTVLDKKASAKSYLADDWLGKVK